jgi:hypothetical protein
MTLRGMLNCKILHKSSQDLKSNHHNIILENIQKYPNENGRVRTSKER